MIITRKHLSRRTFLRGAGAVIGLPLLDAMVPALGWAQDAKPQPPTAAVLRLRPQRHGHAELDARRRRGRTSSSRPSSSRWSRSATTRSSSPGLMDHNANALGDGGGDHARASASFLTGAHPRESGSDIHAGVSADQVAAAGDRPADAAAVARTGPGRHAHRRPVRRASTAAPTPAASAGARRRRPCRPCPTRGTSSNACSAPSTPNARPGGRGAAGPLPPEHPRRGRSRKPGA